MGKGRDVVRRQLQTWPRPLGTPRSRQLHDETRGNGERVRGGEWRGRGKGRIGKGKEKEGREEGKERGKETGKGKGKNKKENKRKRIKLRKGKIQKIGEKRKEKREK